MKFKFLENDSIEIGGLVHIAQVGSMTPTYFGEQNLPAEMWRVVCQAYDDRMFKDGDYRMRGQVVRVHGAPTCLWCIASRLNRP